MVTVLSTILFIAAFMCWMLSFYIISDKNRGCGFLLLAFLFPVIGFILALCLKRHEPKKEDKLSLDITSQKK